MRGISIAIMLLISSCSSIYAPTQSVTMPDGRVYKANIVSGTRVIIDGEKVEVDRKKEPGWLDKASTLATGVAVKEVFEDD